jgi:hypothetical protein
VKGAALGIATESWKSSAYSLSIHQEIGSSAVGFLVTHLKLTDYGESLAHLRVFAFICPLSTIELGGVA